MIPGNSPACASSRNRILDSHTHPATVRSVFRNASAGLTFLTRSTVATDRSVEHAGGTYPLVDVEISSASPSGPGAAGSSTPRAGCRPSSAATERAQAADEGAQVSAALKRLPGAQIVHRHGRVFVINKRNPRMKARQE